MICLKDIAYWGVIKLIRGWEAFILEDGRFDTIREKIMALLVET